MGNVDTWHEQASPDHSMRLRTLQQHFEKQQEAFSKEKRTLQQQRRALREQRSFLKEYRQSFTEAGLLLWKRRQQHLRESGAFDEGAFQQRLEDYREFEDFIRRQQLICQQLQLEYQQRLTVLHDRRTILRELGRDSQPLREEIRERAASATSRNTEPQRANKNILV